MKTETTDHHREYRPLPVKDSATYKTRNRRVIKFDELLEQIGEFGPYQKRVFILASLVTIVGGYQTMSPVFLLNIPNYRCKLPSFENDTYKVQSEHHHSLINTSIPMTTENDVEEYKKCKLYNITSSNSTGNMTDYECHEWVYDTSVTESSGITDFNMVCGFEIARSNTNMVGFAGGFLGAFLFGPLADTIGRKKALLLSLFFNVLAGVVSSFAPNFGLYLATIFVLGISNMALFMVAFVMVVEVVGPSKRTFTGVVIEFFWVIGEFLLAAEGYGLRNWRHLRLALSIPSVIFVSYWWLLPESPRWLISKERYTEAGDIIKRIAKSNNREVDDSTLKRVVVDDNENQLRIWHMFTSPVLLLRAIVVFFNWYSINIVYYGLTLNVTNLSGNIYLNYTLSVIMELVAYSLTYIFMTRIGRKPLLCFSMVFCGVACLASMFPVMYGDDSVQWTLILLSMLGKLGSSAAFAVIYVFTAEIFPTVVRQSGVAASSLFEGIGGMTSPYIADLGILVGGKLKDALPLIVFGCFTIAAGLLSTLLPETRNKKLPETVEDAINFGKKPEEVQEITVYDKKKETKF